MNDRLSVGGNMPPEPIDPIPGYLLDAQSILDEVNALGEVTTDDQAAYVDGLIDRAEDSERAIEAARVNEKAPHLAAGKAVDERYKPVKDVAVKAKTVALEAVGPHRKRKDEARLAAERDARQKAYALAEDARIKHASDDLHDQVQAEADIAAARKLEATANKMAKQATGLRTVWEAQFQDHIAFGKWAWANCNPEYLEFLQGLAAREVRLRKCALPGVEAIERKVAR
jgi:flavin-binding protein dodecin